MKKLTLLLAATIAFAGSSSLYAQAKKKPDAAAPATTPAKPDAKPAEKPAAKADAKPADAKAGKPMPLYSVVDEIDAAGKTFTHKNDDGKAVKFIVTDKTIIKQGEADAKFEDIKVGDAVSGLRVKKNAEGTEYEVVKITKFGAPAAKGAAKDKKADAPKEKKAAK